MQVSISKIAIATSILLLLNCSSNSDNSETNSNIPTIGFVKTLGGSKNDTAKSVTKTSDGGYIILGSTQSMDGDILNKPNDSYNYWILKFDENNNLQWQKNYGGTNDDQGSKIIETTDGGYAVLGYSQSTDGDVTQNSGAQDFWVAKLNNTGSIEWQKSFGFAGADSGISLIQTKDMGFLLVGVLDVTASGELGNSKNLSQKHAGGSYWAIKINAFGTKEWSHFYGGSFTDTPYDVVQTEDNGFIIVGSSDSNDVDITSNKGSYDFWVLKISEIGELIWEKSFGGSEIDEARAITKSGDGNYIIIGDTRSNNFDVSKNRGAADLWVIKLSPTGNLIWEKTFGGTGFDVGRSIAITQENSFIISGSSRSTDGDVLTNQGQNDAWVLKIDTNANLEWQKTIGGTDIDFAFDAIELNNKSLIGVGESNSSDFDIKENKGFTDLLIFKLN